jgi:hypothetical protein
VEASERTTMAYSRALRLAQINRPRTVSLRRLAILSIESQTVAERLPRRAAVREPTDPCFSMHHFRCTNSRKTTRKRGQNGRKSAQNACFNAEKCAFSVFLGNSRQPFPLKWVIPRLQNTQFNEFLGQVSRKS